MKKIRIFLLMLIVSTLMSGCISKKKYLEVQKYATGNPLFYLGAKILGKVPLAKDVQIELLYGYDAKRLNESSPNVDYYARNYSFELYFGGQYYEPLPGVTRSWSIPNISFHLEMENFMDESNALEKVKYGGIFSYNKAYFNQSMERTLRFEDGLYTNGWIGFSLVLTRLDDNSKYSIQLNLSFKKKGKNLYFSNGH